MKYHFSQKGEEPAGKFLQKFSGEVRGFTLVETLVVIGIFLIISIGTTSLFKEVYSGGNQKVLALQSVDQARLIADTFVNELRNASVGNDGSYPLAQASTTQIIFFTTYRATGLAVNRVRYFASSTILYKGIVIPTGNPLAYNLSNEKLTAVQTSLAATTSPLFSYYDGTYNGAGTALTQPVNVNSVKFILMSIPLLIKNTQTGTTTFLLSSGAAMRTLKTNLGN